MPLVESAYAKKAAVKIEPNIVKKSATRQGYTFFAISCWVAATRRNRVSRHNATSGLAARRHVSHLALCQCEWLEIVLAHADTHAA